MEKEIIVMSDLEMGAGTLTDDFISDNALAQLMRSIGDKKHPVDLVFNGDTFNFMLCPIGAGGCETYPRHIDKEVSIAKLNRIARAHKKVFQSFHDFASLRKNRLFFIVGNHDPDLVFPEVQEALKNQIGGQKENIIFPGFHCDIEGVHMEHGHQYDFLYKVNLEQLFFTHKKKNILNVPPTTFWLMTQITDIKKQHPMYDRIMPRLMHYHKIVAARMLLKTSKYVAKLIFYYPIRYFKDPTYNCLSAVKIFFRQLKKAGLFDMWLMESATEIYAKQLPQSNNQNGLSVLGHGHDKLIKKVGHHTIIQTGAWRDEYNLETTTMQMIPKSKNYVSIKVSNSGIRYELMEYPITRSAINFDEAMKDETKHLYRAAEEEGYPLSL